MKFYKIILLILLFSCNENNNTDCCAEIDYGNREDLIIENNVFKISYNEVKEQPNWIEYTVKDFVKVADRGNMDFYLINNIYFYYMLYIFFSCKKNINKSYLRIKI